MMQRQELPAPSELLNPSGFFAVPEELPRFPDPCAEVDRRRH